MNDRTLIRYLESFPERGDRPALFYKTGYRTFRISYQDLYDLSRRIARYLAEKGLQKGDRVILWGSNSPAWIGLYLGCLLRGVIAVPLDVRGSVDFVKKVSAFTGASLLVCDRMKAPEENAGRWIDFETLKKNAAGLPAAPVPDTRIQPSDVAAILFTSGTTATPKGVALTHENIFSNVESLRALVPGFEKNNKWLSVLPLSHIFEQTIGFWFPLSLGASLTYLKVLNAASIFSALEADGIKVVTVVPRLLGLIRNGILREVQRLGKEKIFDLLLRLADFFPVRMRRALFPDLSRKLGKLKHFIVGGATLEPELERFWARVGVSLLQGYGLTETSPVISCNRPEEARLGSIGKLLPGVEVKLNPDKEILVRGKNVFQGYYRAPEVSREAFEGDWFKTGDLGEFDADHFLYFKGRKKDVIVTAEGLNVYPDDLEAVLHTVPGVKECCVVGIPREGREIIHAALIPEDPSLDLKTAVEKANSTLANFQKIQDYSRWPDEDFPRTSTMKIKKNEVLQRLQGTLRAEKGAAAKETKENPLYRILAQLARLKPAEIHPGSRLGDDLGLTSLDRIELAAMIQEELHLDMDDSDLLPSTTVAEIESRIRSKGSSSNGTSLPRWPVHPWVRALRRPFQDLFLLPVLRFFCRIKIEGIENLRDLPGPVIFVANHESHFDAPALLAALPPALRGRVAMAAWKEFFDAPLSRPFLWFKKRVLFFLTSFGFNIYLWPQIKGFKKSMEHTGWLMDRGFHILFFPEGARTLTGKMSAFRPGIGMLLSSMNAAAVPVGLKGLFKILPPQRRFPRRGDVTVRFGKPVFFSESDPLTIALRLKQEVGKLIL